MSIECRLPARIQASEPIIVCSQSSESSLSQQKITHAAREGIDGLEMEMLCNDIQKVRLILDKENPEIQTPSQKVVAVSRRLFGGVSTKVPPHIKLGYSEALLVAARLGEYSMIEMLLKRGADPDFRKSCGKTALHEAICCDKSAEIIELLLKNKANPNLPDKNGFSPLHCALVVGNVATVALLLEWGANSNLPNKIGATPLHFAITFKNIMMMILLLKSGANPNFPDNAGLTPFRSVVCQYPVEVVKEFLNHGADPNLLDEMGDTYFDWVMMISNQKRKEDLVGSLFDVKGLITASRIIEKHNSIKRLAMLNGIGGYFTLHGKKMGLEGEVCSWKIYHDYGKKSHSIENVASDERDELGEAYRAVPPSEELDEAFMQRILLGKLTVVQKTIYFKDKVDHSIAVVFCGGLLAVCDRGVSTIYSVDMEKLQSLQLLGKESFSRAMESCEWGVWLKSLPLLDNQDETQEIFGKLMESSMQKVGNCMVASFKLSIRAALLLLAYRKHRGDPDVRETLQRMKLVAKEETLVLRQEARERCMRAFGLTRVTLSSLGPELEQFLVKCKSKEHRILQCLAKSEGKRK